MLSDTNTVTVILEVAATAEIPHLTGKIKRLTRNKEKKKQ